MFVVHDYVVVLVFVVIVVVIISVGAGVVSVAGVWYSMFLLFTCISLLF